MAVETLTIPNQNNEKLAGNFHKANNKKEVVIVCHGHTGNKDRIFIGTFCKALNKAGYNSCRFDFSGNGKSEGRFEESTYTKEIQDLKSVVGYFYGKGFRIGTVGHSQGGTICVLAATEERISFVVSVAGVSHPSRFKERFLEWTGISEDVLEKKGCVKWFKEKDKKWFNITKEFFEDLEKHNPIESVKNIHVPILFVHGDKDEAIDVQEAKDIFQAANEPKELIVIKGGCHQFKNPGKMEEMISNSISWIKKNF